MRLISKINVTLLGVVAVSAVLNFATLKLAVMPSFVALEEQAAERNQSRVMEAIQLQQEQVANSAGDYAIWDDTHQFMQGEAPDYEDKNVTAESLETLGVNYFVALDTQGHVLLNKGYDHGADEPQLIRLLDVDKLPESHRLVADPAEIKIQSALMRTGDDLVVIGYSPILRSDRSGERAGTLVLGRILDLEALKSATKVDFDLVDEGTPTIDADRGSLDKRVELNDLDGKAIATLVSHTPRDISAAGERTVWTTLLLLLGAASLLLIALSTVLRHIAVRRIEHLRSHLTAIASSGNLETMMEDGKNDELSETLQSFNAMARQLAELREKLRRQDYEHGAADQAAGLLHNVRNAVSPISALAWELSRGDQPAWKENLMKAVDQLKEPEIEAARAAKLSQLVTLSAVRLLDEDSKRREDVGCLVAMIQHVDDILKEQDQSSHLERVVEPIDLQRSVRSALHLIERRPGLQIKVNLPEGTVALGYKVQLDQVLGNLIVNAAEAVEALAAGEGVVEIDCHPAPHVSGETVEITISDTGVGIAGGDIARIFAKGYSTKPDGQRGLGLHWCANAVNAMGGRLIAESDGHGRGARFKLVLPSARQVREAA